MRWPLQRRSEHHVWTRPARGTVDLARCCCGWIGASTANPLDAFGQWTRHVSHYRRADDPCTREETP